MSPFKSGVGVTINEKARSPLRLSSELGIVAPVQNKKSFTEKETKKRKNREVKPKKIVVEEDP